MFNGMIDSREVQDQMRSSSQSLGGSSSHHHMEQNTANMRLQGQQDYNMPMHEYYRLWEDQREQYFANFTAQQQEVLQVSMRLQL
jgi:hypothetical protein